MTDQPIVREISVEDAERFEEINYAAVLEGNSLMTYPDEYEWDRQRREKFISELPANHPLSRAWGVYTNGVLQGFLCCIGQKPKRIQHVVAIVIVIDPDKRGRGFGKLLMNQLFEYVRKEDKIKRVQLSVIASNTSARELYKRFGFEIEGRRKNAYIMPDGTFDHEVLMGWMK